MTRIQENRGIRFFVISSELKVRNYSKKTIKSYCLHNHLFLEFVKKSPRDITNSDIKKYIDYLMENRKSSFSTINVIISALKFYYTQILNRKFFVNIKHPKKSKYLPIVLSKE